MGHQVSELFSQNEVGTGELKTKAKARPGYISNKATLGIYLSKEY